MALQSAYLGDLVITAYRQIVGRAPALPRRIVSHNLDCGVVYGAYIVSYDNVTSGPKLEIRNKPSSTG